MTSASIRGCKLRVCVDLLFVSHEVCVIIGKLYYELCVYLPFVIKLCVVQTTKCMSCILLICNYRRALKRNESIKYVVPDPVIDYIKQNGLYKAQELYE